MAGRERTRLTRDTGPAVRTDVAPIARAVGSDNAANIRYRTQRAIEAEGAPGLVCEGSCLTWGASPQLCRLRVIGACSAILTRR